MPLQRQILVAKPEYLDVYGNGAIANVEYKDNGEMSSFADVKFDFFRTEAMSLSN